MLDEYRNLDMRPVGLDSLGRLTRNDILWACTQAVTISRTEPILSPSQLDPAFCRMRGYSDYYTSCMVLRNAELPYPQKTIAPDCPVVMFLGHEGTAMDRRTMLHSQLIKAARQSIGPVENMMKPGFTVFDTIIIDQRWTNVGAVMTVALRKMQAAHPDHRMVVTVFPGKTMLRDVYNAFIRFGFHAFGGTDIKRFIPASKPGPCLIMFSIGISDMMEGRTMRKTGSGGRA